MTIRNKYPAQRASLVLNFVNKSRIDPRITFTRSSIATRVNSSGLIETVTANTPRIDYNPVTNECRGLLVEQSKINNLKYSADFSNAIWQAISNKQVASSASVAPDGTLTAWTLTDSSSIAYEGILQQFTVANDSSDYVFSIFVKKTTGGTAPIFGFNMSLTGGTVVNVNLRLNTDTGLSTATAGSTSTVEDYNTYWRFSGTITNNSTGNTLLTASLYPAVKASLGVSDNVSNTGSATIWGSQLESGTVASSYIPTTSSAVTRSADVASVNTLTPWYTSAGGSIYAEFVTRAPVPTGFDTRILEFNDGTITGRALLYASTTSNTLAFQIRTSGVNQANITVSNTFIVNTVIKTASAMAVNDFAFSVRGGTASTDTSGTLPTFTEFDIATVRSGGTETLNGWLRCIRYYPLRVSDSQLQNLTVP